MRRTGIRRRYDNKEKEECKVKDREREREREIKMMRTIRDFIITQNVHTHDNV